MLSSKTLQKSIEESVEVVQAREADLDRARLILVDAERELRLLVELAELRGVEIPAAAKDSGTAEPQALNGAKVGSGRAPSRGRTALLENVIEILSEAGQPMQIQALMAAVGERQVRIPGKGTQANLISVISRDPRIVRPQRGYYGLSEWGLKGSRQAGQAKLRRGRSGARK